MSEAASLHKRFATKPMESAKYATQITSRDLAILVSASLGPPLINGVERWTFPYLL